MKIKERADSDIIKDALIIISKQVVAVFPSRWRKYSMHSEALQQHSEI